jgi:hypothetical protein
VCVFFCRFFLYFKKPSPHLWAGLKEKEKSFEFYLNEGFTLVLNRVQERDERVNRLCESLGEFFGHYVAANLYVTPPQQRGFALHHDAQDAFIIQLSGSKAWRVCGAWPRQAPIASFQLVKPPRSDAAPPCSVFVLSAGDTLYIPRGYLHEAETRGVPSRHTSMHLTLGLENGLSSRAEVLHFFAVFDNDSTQTAWHLLLRAFTNGNADARRSLAPARAWPLVRRVLCRCLADFASFLDNDDIDFDLLSAPVHGLRLWVSSESPDVSATTTTTTTPQHVADVRALSVFDGKDNCNDDALHRAYDEYSQHVVSTTQYLLQRARTNLQRHNTPQPKSNDEL